MRGEISLNPPRRGALIKLAVIVLALLMFGHLYLYTPLTKSLYNFVIRRKSCGIKPTHICPSSMYFQRTEERESEGGTWPLLVLVAASSPRTGSSYLAEMLSSVDASMFIFEPFWIYSFTAQPQEGAVTPAEEVAVNRIISPTAAREILINLLTCRFTQLPDYLLSSRVLRFVWRKPGLNKGLHTSRQLAALCEKQKIRVVKTIRLRVSDVLPLVQRSSQRVHVISLVRDPRAIANSLHSMSHLWPRRRLRPEAICAGLKADLLVAHCFKHPRFKVIRYSDMMRCPLRTARDLFNMFRIPVPAAVMRFLHHHHPIAPPIGSPYSRWIYNNYELSSISQCTEDEQRLHALLISDDPPLLSRDMEYSSSQRQELTRRRTKSPPSKRQLQFSSRAARTVTNRSRLAVYFSTRRKMGFDHLHWTSELPVFIRDQIEYECCDVLEMIGLDRNSTQQLFL